MYTHKQQQPNAPKEVFQGLTERKNQRILASWGLYLHTFTLSVPNPLNPKPLFPSLSKNPRKMETRLANIWRLTVNEKKFIETALQSDLRIDGRRPFDFRNISIKFSRHCVFPFFQFHSFLYVFMLLLFQVLNF